MSGTLQQLNKRVEFETEAAVQEAAEGRQESEANAPTPLL